MKQYINIYLLETMNYSFFDFLTLIGSLSLFLYGMKIMSEGLQKAAGDKMRTILSAMTKNRVMGVCSGLLITALIQSSSATTVMVVSFVNAGLLSLTQSISVIMGANIGTTVTAWIISLLGFQINIAAFAIPLMAIAIPFVFSSNSKRKYIGEFIMGFAFLFMGLEMLKNSVPDLQSNPEILSFLSQYTDLGFGSVLIFLGVGTLLTVIVQSSSATMAITLIMCAKGWIPFELGAAMVLGENIGTTITANIAAIPANVSAKRAALAHLAFNVFGVIWMLVVFYPVISLISKMVSSTGIGDPTTNMAATTYGLSLFHTLFNVVNTFIMVWFVNLIARIVSAIIPQKENDEEFNLRYISGGLLSTSELSLIQAKKEIIAYNERTERMLGMVRSLYKEDNENDFLKLYSRIEKYESISDRLEVEIASYLTNVGSGRLSKTSKLELQSMFRIISEIESISDGCFNLARIILRKKDVKATYTTQMNENIEIMMGLTEKALQTMKKQLELLGERQSKDEYNRSKNIENEINNFRNQIKQQNIEGVKEQDYDYQASVTYMDMINEYEKIGDYIINVAEVLNEQ
ncbi:phosphate:Na+ symporter [Dysgonomonadaceae bacterium PH5-43]|nr:phosphate:Na+ symporter [Dysgonomonadaceae bacterium PH5-43]